MNENKLKLLTNAVRVRRTMVWAIDLDDGTLLESLGVNLSRNKTQILPVPRASVPDWWWPKEKKEEL
jgi:chitinase